MCGLTVPSWFGGIIAPLYGNPLSLEARCWTWPLTVFCLHGESRVPFLQQAPTCWLSCVQVRAVQLRPDALLYPSTPTTVTHLMTSCFRISCQVAGPLRHWQLSQCGFGSSNPGFPCTKGSQPWLSQSCPFSMAGVSSQFGFSFHAGNREFHAKPQLISDGGPGDVKPGEVCCLHGKCCILKQLQRPRKDLVSISYTHFLLQRIFLASTGRLFPTEPPGKPSRGSFWPRDWTYVSYISCIGRWVLYH